MSKNLSAHDIILKDDRILSVVSDVASGPGSVAYADSEGMYVGLEIDYSVSRALDRLKADPSLGARFLSRTSGNGDILWAGSYASSSSAGKSLGVKVLNKRDGAVYVGDNVLGNMLMRVRDAYLEWIRTAAVEEVPVPVGQVVVDFTRKGELESDVTVLERGGDDSFIHVDLYNPRRFRFDAGRDGTTGHNRRESDDEVEFHTFTCPFGTTSRYPVRVSTAAEASYLYEKALRGELDWTALFDRMRNEGTVSGQASDRELAKAAAQYRAQFAWMREQISTDNALRQKKIVAPSFLVSDSSLGRSVYDPQSAPSPAHVLARYIDNPLLLYSPSENVVARALSLPDKDDPRQLVVVPDAVGDGVLNVLVVGSDTIGGRQPGRKAAMESERMETVDANGRKVMKTIKTPKLQMKTPEDARADYDAFKARMDSILATIPDDVRVRFITGSCSTMGDTVGVGTPRLLEKYVRERGGMSYGWDFAGHGLVLRGEAKGDGRYSAVLMDHFAECIPVLSGQDGKVTFRTGDDLSEFTFMNGDLGTGDSVICFSASDDASLRNVDSIASFLSMRMPVIHVQDVKSEAVQEEDLHAGSVLSRASFSGEMEIGESLFNGVVRSEWVPGESTVAGSVDPESGFAVPLVSEYQNTPVAVDGIRFHTILGLYAALALKDGGASRQQLVDLAAGEMSLQDTVRSIPVLSPGDEERYMVRAVRLMSGSDSAFARYLVGLDGRPVVCPSSVDAGRLFTTVDGHGENRFGVVLAAESVRLRELRDARLRREEEERLQALKEYSRLQKMSVKAAAPGEKVKGGLPRSVEESRGAVWFIGTNTPDVLALDDRRSSFVIWDDDGGADKLNRDKAGAVMTPDSEGGQVPNDLVFLFPSDIAAVTGKRAIKKFPDSGDLTGVVRPSPLNGEPVPVAFGIPVKYNNMTNELLNDSGSRCSYRLDNESADFVDSVVLADSMARTVAFRNNFRLCVMARVRMDGEIIYPIGQVFRDKYYGFDKELGKKGWIDNPHKAPQNAATLDRYTSLLEHGAAFPLNCIPLAHAGYSYEPGDVAGRNEAYGRFMADFNMSLKIANSTALGLGVPMRFPIDDQGRLDLGPDIPEEFRAYAEERVNSLIGVVRREDITTRALPVISRTTFVETARHASEMQNTGIRIDFRPNSLAAAFGLYESDEMIASGQRLMPQHRMDFVMKDAEGNDMYFSLRDTKSTKGRSLAEINDILGYHVTEFRSFTVYTTHPEAVNEFKAALNGYVERASQLQVEYRIVGDDDREAEDFSLDGFVDVAPSFEWVRSRYEFKDGVDHSVGRPVDILNSASRLDGTGEVDEYAGKVKARDGFSGYAQIRWTLTNGKTSGWRTLGNDRLDLAKDIVMKTIGRSYPYELDRVVPETNVIDMMVKAAAVDMAGEEFRRMRYTSPGKHTKEDDKVVSIERTASEVAQSAPAAKPEPAPSVPVKDVSVPDVSDISFSVSSGSYAKRTQENANADGVDFTLQFAVDFSTAGEKATSKAAGDSLISVAIPVTGSGIDLSPKGIKSVAGSIISRLPDEFLASEPCGFNIAGNGLYTLRGRKIGQDEIDLFVTGVLSVLRDSGVDIKLVRTGGQTGVDEAGAAAAVALGIPCEVHAPEGWKFRNADNKDMSDESAFKSRFERKDYESLRKQAGHDYDKSVMFPDDVESVRGGMPFNIGVSEHVGKWSREEAVGNPSVLYVFTDNTDRDSGRNVIDRNSEYYREYGNGKDDLHFPTVTSAVLRGLDNAVPVSTQRWYHGLAKGENGRWTDADAAEFRKVVSGEFGRLREKIGTGRYSEVMFPEGGLFNGKISAITKERTPKLYRILEGELKSLRSFIGEINGEKSVLLNKSGRKESFQPAL